MGEHVRLNTGDAMILDAVTDPRAQVLEALAMIERGQ